MNCDKMEDQLIGYLVKTLKKEEREELENHLSSCRKCQKKLEELEKARGFFREWKPVSPPPDLKQKVLDNVRAQKLIETKTAKESPTGDMPHEGVVEFLKKRVLSEQIRIYKMLTDYLGREKGEEVFDHYLEEEVREQMAVPVEKVLSEYQALSQSLGLDIEVKRLEGNVMKETVHNCSYFSMAEEFGMKANPCEVICLRMAKLREKFQPIKVERIKKMPNKEGECIFLFTPLEPKPSQ